MTCRRDESSWLSFIRELWGENGLLPGHGDDCALLPALPFAITTDFLAEGRDFERGWGPWEAVGYKALAANLSDLASSGARPHSFFLTLAIPDDLEEVAVEKLLQGIHALSVREECLLAGGDLSGSRSGLCISVTALGDQRYPALVRSGGRPGDLLYVSGALGGPHGALGRFRVGATLSSFDPARPPGTPEEALLDRFFRPPSQTALGEYLAKSGLCSACLDLSDGLSRDLNRLCEASKCGAVLLVDDLPLEAELAGEALAAALEGGEEQILLFAVPPEKIGRLEHSPAPLFQIGALTEAGGVSLRNSDGTLKPLTAEGFDHFSRRRCE